MLLSIIIPIYNEKEKLPQLISTLKNNFSKTLLENFIEAWKKQKN